MTLLQGIGVLAVDDKSVVSERESGPEASSPKAEGKRVLVTLMTNSTQAKALQLAVKYGAVSLALRNPLDAKRVDIDSTLLSDLSDEYSKLKAALDVPAQPSSVEAAPGEPQKKEEETRWVVTEPVSVDAIWKVLVNRGGAINFYEFRQPRARAVGRPASEPESAPGAWLWKEPSIPTDGTSHSRAELAGKGE